MIMGALLFTIFFVGLLAALAQVEANMIG